jgi:hypothetical protein
MELFRIWTIPPFLLIRLFLFLRFFGGTMLLPAALHQRAFNGLPFPFRQASIAVAVIALQDLPMHLLHVLALLGRELTRRILTSILELWPFSILTLWLFALLGLLLWSAAGRASLFLLPEGGVGSALLWFLPPLLRVPARSYGSGEYRQSDGGDSCIHGATSCWIIPPSEHITAGRWIYFIGGGFCYSLKACDQMEVPLILK